MPVKKKQPSWIAPMLATLVDKPFSKRGWLFEKKFDGVRCIVFMKDQTVKLYSRNKKLMNQTYPEIVKGFEKYKKINFIMDGEIVFKQGKIEHFSPLQSRMHRFSFIEEKNLNFFAFDLLYYLDNDLRNLPLIERKKLLKSKFSFSIPIRYTSHIVTFGVNAFKKITKQGWEGVIAKNSQAPYLSKRGRYWLKFKAVNQQEFVIGGYTKPQKSRVGFGSLLIGFYENKKLKYAGKVGTGYNEELLMYLSKKLKKIEIKTSPFINPIKEKNAHFVSPKLVCECGYTEWTKDHKLRHPRFLSLRSDKRAKEVTKHG